MIYDHTSYEINFDDCLGLLVGAGLGVVVVVIDVVTTVCCVSFSTLATSFLSTGADITHSGSMFSQGTHIQTKYLCARHMFEVTLDTNIHLVDMLHLTLRPVSMQIDSLFV